MSSTAYVHLHTLNDGHSASINCLSFSPDGHYLASGGDDNALIIWNVGDGTFLYRLLFESAVDRVLWHPLHYETLIVACENGTIFQVRGFSLSGHERHDILMGVRGTIHCLDFDPVTHCLAVSIGPEVHITREHTKDLYTGGVKLPSPPNPPADASDFVGDDRLRAVGVHFSRRGQLLVVCYLAHGVIGWDPKTRVPLWHILTGSTTPNIGSSALSPDGRNLMVYNFSDELHLYAVGTRGLQQPRRRYKFDAAPKSKHALQMAFLHQGRAVVCGTTTGNACIWETTLGEFFQLLPHDHDVIQAIAVRQRGTFSFIATGSADKGQGTYIKIWRAKTGPAKPEELEESVAEVFEALTSNRLFVLQDEVRRGLLVSLIFISCLFISWALYRAGCSIPWSSFPRLSWRMFVAVCYYGNRAAWWISRTVGTLSLWVKSSVKAWCRDLILDILQDWAPLREDEL